MLARYTLGLILAVSLCLIGSRGYSQSVSILDGYINEALSSNLSIRGANELVGIEQNRKKQTDKLWMPSVDLAASYLVAQGGRKINFPVGDLFNPAYLALNQLTGAEQFPTDLENINTQLTPNNFVDIGVTISKPLINQSIKYAQKTQEALIHMASLNADMQLNEIRYQVREAYYHYLSTIQAEEVLTEQRALLNEVREVNTKLLKYDKATPDINSDVDFQIAMLESQELALIARREIAQTLFNSLLNRPSDDLIEVDTALLSDYAIDDIRDQSALIDQAIASRPELDQLEIARHIQDLIIGRVESEGSPSLGIRGGVGLQTEEFTLDDGGPLYTIGLSLSWNLWDGGRNDALARQQIALQVTQAYKEMNALLGSLKSDEAAVTAAKISYDATLARYRHDRAILIEVLNAQNQWVVSQLNINLKLIEVLSAKASLDRAVYQSKS